jgi:hypothetical protein
MFLLARYPCPFEWQNPELPLGKMVTSSKGSNCYLSLQMNTMIGNLSHQHGKIQLGYN